MTSTHERLAKTTVSYEGRHLKLEQLLKRPEMSYSQLRELFPDQVPNLHPEAQLQVELEVKYAGYIERQQTDIAKLDHFEELTIPEGLDFKAIKGLRNEAQEKLHRHRPISLGQAARLSGVSPADISILLVALKKNV
jgi:tRNA uridine 5-carboxymethylaminomethyl modification enzyme